MYNALISYQINTVGRSVHLFLVVAKSPVLVGSIIFCNFMFMNGKWLIFSLLVKTTPPTCNHSTNLKRRTHFYTSEGLKRLQF